MSVCSFKVPNWSLKCVNSNAPQKVRKHIYCVNKHIHTTGTARLVRASLSPLLFPSQISAEGVWDRGLCLYLKPAGKGCTLISHAAECICTEILFTLKQPSPSASSSTPDGGGSEVYGRLMKRVLWSTFARDSDLRWGFEIRVGPEHCGCFETEWHTRHVSTGKQLYWTMWFMSLPWWGRHTNLYTNTMMGITALLRRQFWVSRK